MNKYLSRAALLVLLLTAFALIVGPTQARADTVRLAGGAWLGGQGVDVYSNESKTHECVELVGRLYRTRGWISGDWPGDANDMYRTAPANLAKHPQGSISHIAPGDVIVLDDGGWGHVAVVDTVTNNADGSKSVQTVNQNTQYVYMNITLANGSLGPMQYLSSYSRIGVVHAPASAPPPAYNGVYTSICTRLDRLTAGQFLRTGQYLVSQNGLAVLIMQGDGNLVLYGWGGVMWKSDTAGSGAARAVMQGDGNFVLYRDNNTAAWNSRTAGQGVTRLVLQDDGNLVGYTDANAVKWSSNTGGHGSLTPLGTHRFTANMVMRQNQYLRSIDKRFMLVLQGDGNLVLYGAGGHTLWSSGTTGKGVTWAIMQGDGNFVLYTASNTAVWSTKTGGSGASTATLQNDGNFVLYTSSSAAKWDSHTGGRTSDERPPSTVQSGADDAWHRGPVTVGLSAADSGGAGLSGGPARTEYKIDSGAWHVGSSLTVSSDGNHTVSYRSVDAAGNVETAKSCTVRIDTRGPTTLARGVSGRKSSAMRLRYSITDGLSPQAARVSVVVRNSRGRAVKRFSVGTCAIATWRSVKWTPKTRGTFRYYVYAYDLAGNAQAIRGSAKVVVR